MSVKVRPGASRTQIDGVENDTLKVRLTAPPEGGKANEQLIELLSEALGVRKSAIRIARGHASRQKVVEIAGSEFKIDRPRAGAKQAPSGKGGR